MEVLLADHQFEHISGQHIEIAANHFRDAEVRDHQSEAQQGRRNQPITRAGQGDRHEPAPTARAHGAGGVKQPGIGAGQRGQQEHQHVRKHGKALGHDDARRAINFGNSDRSQGAFENTLVAKPVDQRNCRKKRRREQRHQGNGAEHCFEAHATALQGIGKNESHWHHHSGDQGGNPQAVEERFAQRR